MDENTRLKILQIYMELIKKIEYEFKKELAITRTDEVVFQQLLTRYKFFLRPGAILIESHPVLRGKALAIPDFHVQINEDEHIYVEIEPPFCKPFEGSEPSSRLKEALEQVRKWKEILIQKSTEGSNRYMIIIGLLNNLNKEEKEALHRFNKAQIDLVVITWDWILENINEIKRKMMSYFLE